MTRLKYALSALLLVAFSATAFAEEGYDEWTCREGDLIKGVGLQCISCGIQDYYASQGQTDVVPSSKWLALLASSARQFRVLKSGRPTSTGYGSEETDAMKKVIISQIQAYGFCTKYISKDAQNVTGGKNYRDLSMKEWDVIVPLIKRDQEESIVNSGAKAFGFRNSSALGFDYGTDAMNSMRDMFDDSHLNNFAAVSKRANFKNKLNNALSDYDISGEKKKTPEVIAGGDKDNGLRRCLEEVQQRLNSPNYRDNNQAMCERMASACKLADNSFCRAGTSSNSSSSSQQYQPASGTRKSLPSPPGPGKSSGAIN